MNKDIKELFNQVKEITAIQGHAYLERDLMYMLILQNIKIISLLEKLNESI